MTQLGSYSLVLQQLLPTLFPQPGAEDWVASKRPAQSRSRQVAAQWGTSQICLGSKCEQAPLWVTGASPSRLG